MTRAEFVLITAQEAVIHRDVSPEYAYAQAESLWDLHLQKLAEVQGISPVSLESWKKVKRNSQVQDDANEEWKLDICDELMLLQYENGEDGENTWWWGLCSIDSSEFIFGSRESYSSREECDIAMVKELKAKLATLLEILK